jgi:hypothetical protein
MKRVLLFAAIAGVVLVFGPTDAGACSCAPPKPLSEAFKDAGLVFVGKVTAIEPRKAGTTPLGPEFSPKTIRFTLTEVFRGTELKEIELYSRGGGSPACEYTFREGQEYLVYANKRGDGPGWETSICTRTKQVRFAGEDLTVLRKQLR